MISLKKLKVDIYIDGPRVNNLKRFNSSSIIKGFTTNPTLISKMNLPYKNYAKKFLNIVKNKSSSFEVVSNKKKEMINEAKIISSWGSNIYVKIPIINDKGVSSGPIIKFLCNDKINLNITAVFTKKQIDIIQKNINKKSNIIVSIFCGRIADTGRDPIDFIKYAKKVFRGYNNVKILWASPREVLNLIQAEKSGCDIITVTEDLFLKFSNLNKSLHQFSIDTVKMFTNDAKKSNLKIIV